MLRVKLVTPEVPVNECRADFNEKRSCECLDGRRTFHDNTVNTVREVQGRLTFLGLDKTCP